MMKPILACLALVSPWLLVSTSAAKAECVIDQISFNVGLNQGDSTRMRTNVPCDLSFNPYDSEALRDVQAARKPQVGTLKRLSRLRWGYYPKPGYVGPDAFALRVCGEQFGRSGCSLISYDVTVTPR